MVVDMLALGGSAALDALLIRLLSSRSLVKAGCGIRQDLAALARSYPAMAAFAACNAVLDLRPVFAQHVAATGLPVSLQKTALACMVIAWQARVQFHFRPCATACTELACRRVCRWHEPAITHLLLTLRPTLAR